MYVPEPEPGPGPELEPALGPVFGSVDAYASCFAVGSLVTSGCSDCFQAIEGANQPMGSNHLFRF